MNPQKIWKIWKIGKMSKNLYTQSGPYHNSEARFEINYLQYTEYVKYVEYAFHNLGCGGKRSPVVWQQTVDMFGRFTAYTYDLGLSGNE